MSATDSQPTETSSGTSAEAKLPPLRSVHTAGFTQVLDRHHASLAVTTYQAGKLVLLRQDRRNGEAVLNTHFRSFRKPMGFAWERGRFALGTAHEIWEYHDIPAVAQKLAASESSIPHDAVFLPRICQITGDIQVHEMAWLSKTKALDQAQERSFSELWFVNTRFSCLATRSNIYNFVPRWQPSFITALAPQDRCHLNGLGVRDGEVCYVTALGETDTQGGWRENKRSGGILMDVRTNQIITRGLSMPHSPRWHNNQLWVLESGNGGVGVVDEKTGRYEEICRLPGFTRGLDFIGPYAFVGLSQIRETAVFSGIAIADIPQEKRFCGVWAIDTRSGNIAGFVKFMDAVQEIFAVKALDGLMWPEVLSEDQKQIAETYELTEGALRQVPEKLRQENKARLIPSGESNL